MLDIFAEIFSLFILAISCYSDLRERRIPDWLTYTGTAAGVILWLLAGKWQVVLYAVCTFLAAYLLYRLGLWAGGDVKLFTALAALNPYSVNVLGYEVPLILLVFLLSVLSAFLLSFPVMLALIVMRRDLRAKLLSGAHVVIAKAFSVSVLTHVFGLLGLFFVLLPPPVDVLAAIGALVWKPNTGFIPSFFVILLVALFFRVVSMRVYVFRKEKKVDELKEGDVPADFVTEDGRVLPFSWRTAVLAEAGKVPVRLSPLRAAGLYKEDIEWLRYKGVEKISVRTTMPFVPFVAVAYLLSLFLKYFGG